MPQEDANADALIRFLKNRVLDELSVEINEDTSLVLSGLLDSFAIMNTLLELEKITKMKVPTSRINPSDIDTVRQMLFTAERVGIKV